MDHTKGHNCDACDPNWFRLRRGCKAQEKNKETHDTQRHQCHQELTSIAKCLRNENQQLDYSEFDGPVCYFAFAVQQ
jgi:hypothetical protein